jgi:phosphate ABC transporter permease protein PstC/phosphate ABC transporter permease subunit PstA
VGDLIRNNQAWRRGRGYSPARWLGAAVFAGAVIAVAVSIATGSAQGFAHYGLSFVWSTTASPGDGQYATGILIVGTIVTTGVAIILAAPVGLGAAIALSELVPKKVAAVASTLVELLAAVPSIVVGLWAALVLVPIFRVHVVPFLHSVPVLGALFGGTNYGPSIILASTVLAVMILPTLVSLARTAFRAVPVADREAALALGATRWQVVRKVVWPAARPGVGAAVTLGIGRALGEAVAVAMVIGNMPVFPHSLAGEGVTLGSAIVNQFAEAQPGLGTSSIIALGAVLFVLTVVVNIGGQALRRVGRHPSIQVYALAALPAAGAVLDVGPPPATTAVGTVASADGQPAVTPSPSAPPASARPATGEPAASPRFSPQGTLSRRLFVGGVAKSLCLLCVVAAAAPLIALVVYTISRAAPALSFGMLVHPVVPAFVPGGGIGTAIAGSARVVALALVLAAPVGLLAALFLYERPGRLAGALRFSADVLSGVPSILIGIVAYELVVVPMHGASVLAAGIALAVLMLPVMVRADEEAIKAVAVDLQEAGAALGAPRWRVVRSVVLRGSLPGLVAGNLLALARAIGETAPLLFTLASPSFALTLLIRNDGTQPYPAEQQLAWATALVLLCAVLALSALARFVAWSLTRRAR